MCRFNSLKSCKETFSVPSFFSALVSRYPSLPRPIHFSCKRHMAFSSFLIINSSKILIL